MLLVAPVRDEKLLAGRVARREGPRQAEAGPLGRARDHPRRLLGARADDRRERNPRFYKILQAFKKKTGCPVVINTSFNVRGEPIVYTPEDAYRCFMHTNMDALVLENFVLLKKEQPEAKEIDIDAYLAEFGLD